MFVNPDGSQRSKHVVLNVLNVIGNSGWTQQASKFAAKEKASLIFQDDLVFF